MAERATSGVRIRHIDNKHYFIREKLADVFIKILFVKTDKHDSDTFAENSNNERCERHVVKKAEFARQEGFACNPFHSILIISDIVNVDT